MRRAATGELGCVDCKGILADNLVETFAPFRDRRAELAAPPGPRRRGAGGGCGQGRPVAAETMAAVRDAMHLG